MDAKEAIERITDPNHFTTYERDEALAVLRSAVEERDRLAAELAEALRAEPAGLPAESAPGEDERAEMEHWVRSWRTICQKGGCDTCQLSRGGSAKAECEKYAEAVRSALASFAALKQERDDLRGEGVAMRRDYKIVLEQRDEAIVRAETAEAEVERLIEAMKP